MENDEQEPNVWVANFSGHNYSDAEQYGKLRFITRGHVPRSGDRLLYDITTSLRDSEPSDWFLPSGLILLNVLSAAVWMQMHDEMKILIWNPAAGQYDIMVLKKDHIDYLFGKLDEIEEETANG